MSSRGISIAEVLIGMTIIAIVAGAVFLNLSNYRGFQDLDFDAQRIVSTLRDAQQRSVIQDEDSGWGVRFRNQEEDSYELFRVMPPGIVGATTFLKSSLEFDATVGNPTETVFTKISGITTLAVITVKIKNAACGSEPEKCRTITVNANGSIAL